MCKTARLHKYQDPMHETLFGVALVEALFGRLLCYAKMFTSHTSRDMIRMYRVTHIAVHLNLHWPRFSGPRMHFARCNNQCFSSSK